MVRTHYPRTPEQVEQAQAEIIRNGRPGLGRELDEALEAQGERDITLAEWWEWWEWWGKKAEVKP
jgi:hypothetical protein